MPNPRTLICLLFLAACTTEPDAKQMDDLESMKKRVTKLENRVKNLEGRLGRASKGGKAQPTKGGKAAQPPAKGANSPQQPAKGAKSPTQDTPPTPIQVTLTGDAKAVVLTNGKRRFKVPGKAPTGKVTVLAAFGDAELSKKNEITLPKAETAVLNCTAAADGCTVE